MDFERSIFGAASASEENIRNTTNTVSSFLISLTPTARLKPSLLRLGDIQLEDAGRTLECCAVFCRVVLVAGEDRDIHRLDDWTVCLAGAINPIGERLKHSSPLIVFLPLEVLRDEPIGEFLWIIRRGCGRSSQHQQNEKRSDVSDDIPPLLIKETDQRFGKPVVRVRQIEDDEIQDEGDDHAERYDLILCTAILGMLERFVELAVVLF